MTAQNPLDHQGKLSASPLAELLIEIEHAALDGSMRLSHAETRSILYFREGKVVYGASNAREHRLLNVLMEQKKIDPANVAKLPACKNDVELAAMLVGKEVLPKHDVDAAVVIQIERAVISSLTWPDGDWHFSPLVRSRADLVYPVNVHRLLMDYGRCLPSAFLAARFKSVQERFERIAEPNGDLFLQSHEAYVLERVGTEPRTIERLSLECGLPENGCLQALYVLWLGGLLRRYDWNATFSTSRIESIRNARIAMVKQAQNTASTEKPASQETAETVAESENPPALPQKPEISLTDYLTRAEAAGTYYDVLGVDPKAALAEIKSSYLLLAKLFHPDRYHRESPEMLQRVQGAFSSVQVAYETLKSNDARDNYDFKVRKELEMKEKLKAQGVDVSEAVDAKTEQGLESFEIGLSLLMDEDYDRAIPYLGRAAHYSPDNALYRAYYGKALSYDDTQRHKAEGEMQAAIKIDPKNPKIRMMLVDFFIENKMLKRAEGELKRFLELVPNHPEGQAALAKLLQQ